MRIIVLLLMLISSVSCGLKEPRGEFLESKFRYTVTLEMIASKYKVNSHYILCPSESELEVHMIALNEKEELNSWVIIMNDDKKRELIKFDQVITFNQNGDLLHGGIKELERIDLGKW